MTKTAAERITAAIHEAKEQKAASIVALNKIAAKHDILGLITNDAEKGEYVGWTARYRVTL